MVWSWVTVELPSQLEINFLLLFSKRSAFLLYFMRHSHVDRASGSFLKKRTKKLSSTVLHEIALG
jgi:hypothetical protein